MRAGFGRARRLHTVPTTEIATGQAVSADNQITQGNHRHAPHPLVIWGGCIPSSTRIPSTETAKADDRIVGRKAKASAKNAIEVMIRLSVKRFERGSGAVESEGILTILRLVRPSAVPEEMHEIGRYHRHPNQAHNLSDSI
jgi:hypothetical protein